MNCLFKKKIRIKITRECVYCNLKEKEEKEKNKVQL